MAHCKECGNLLGTFDKHCERCGTARGSTSLDSWKNYSLPSFISKQETCPDCNGEGKVAVSNPVRTAFSLIFTFGLAEAIAGPEMAECQRCGGSGNI